MSYDLVTISEIIDEISMGPFGSNIKVECFVDDGIPVLNGSNVDAVKLREDNFRFVTPEKADSLGKANAFRGDIVVTHRGTLGQIAIIPTDSKYQRYVISQSQFRMRCNLERVLPEFVVYYFHTREGQYQILSNKSQVGVPALARPTTTFQSLTLPLPSLAVQKKIIQILSCLDDKIELNNRINKNLEAQAQAIFKSWFVDFEPFQDIEFVDSELGKIPKEWKIVTLSEACSLISRGITPKYIEKSDQIVLNQKCIRGHQVSLAPSRYHVPKKVNEKWLQYGDILVNSTGQGTLGRTAQWYQGELNITVDSHVTIVRPQEPNLIFYIGQFIMGKEYEIESMASGSTGQTELSRERLGALKVIIPPSKLLEDFSAIVEPFMKKITINNHETIQLAKLRDTLLPKLMSGEIQIP